MSRTKEQLLAASNQVKNETQQGANTADRIGGILYDISEHIGEGGGGGGGDTITINPTGFTDGEKIADYSINGQSGVLKAPKVRVTRDLNEGTQIAKIIINGQTTQLYAPEGGGGGGNTGYQKVYFANVASGTVPSAPSPNDYDANSDTFTTSTPQWLHTNVNPQEGQDTYAIWVYFNANGNIVTIDGPVCLTGAGTNGEDGEEIEWIYFRIQNELTVAEMGTIQNYLESCKGNVAAHKWNGSSWDSCTFKDEDAVPLNGGWTDNAQGIDETYKYEYAAFRRSKNGNDGKRTWGDDYFHGPMLWSAFGKQGMDGDGVEYIFYANATGILPTNNENKPQTWNNSTVGKDGKTFQENEFIAAGSDWMDDPIDLSQSGLGQGAVEWVSIRKKQNNEWQAYSSPAVWTRLARDGGAPKEVDHIELYFKAIATHTTPSPDAATTTHIDEPQYADSWFTGEDQSWGADKPHLYCQEKTVYTDHDYSWGSVYYKGQWAEGGGQGPKGDDGYTLVVDPSYAIFEETSRREDANNNPITDDNTQDFDHYAVIPMDLNSWTGYVQLLQGDVAQTIDFDDKAADNCTFTITVTDGTGGEPKGLKIKVTSITAQVTTAKMHFSVNLNDSYYCSVEIPIYINRLGTRFQYIVGDSETTIMKKTVFTDIDGTVYKFNNLGNYLRSSSENISTLKTTVGNSTSGLVKDVSQIKQTSDAISLGVQNGWYNYVFNPVAVDGDVGAVDLDSARIINDADFGEVYQMSKTDPGDWQLDYSIDPKYEDLTGKIVTWFCIVKTLNSDGSRLNFGSGYDSGNPQAALQITTHNGAYTVGTGLVNRTGYDDYDLSTVKCGDRVLNNGWHLCWASVQLGAGRSIIPGSSKVGFNTMQGTWQLYYAGIVMGCGYPTIDMIMQGAGIKKAGIDITQGTINLKADTTNFLLPDGSINPNVSIDHDTGTLHAVNGDFSGTITSTNGQIGGFDIDTNKLNNNNYSAGIIIQNATSSPTQVVKIGSDATDDLSSNPCSMRAESTRTNIGGYNTALYLNAQNASYNYAFHGVGNGVLNGYMQGYKAKIHNIPESPLTSDTYLKLQDGKVQVINSVDSSLSLPKVYLPKLQEIKDTLGIKGSDYSDFCCELVIINQTCIAGQLGGTVDIWGDTRDYHTTTTRDDARPSIVRYYVSQGTPTYNVDLKSFEIITFYITYVGQRFLANYLKG